MNTAGRYTPLNISEVRINGSFWHEMMEKVRTKVIPYQWKALNDQIPGAEPSHCMKNFRIAAGKENGEFAGFVFQDSDLAKCLKLFRTALCGTLTQSLKQLRILP